MLTPQRYIGTGLPADKHGGTCTAVIDLAGPAASDLVEPPVILAVRRAGQLSFWCPWCRRAHFHGIGEGHRVAHCTVRSSPYRQTGYVLREVTP